MPDNACRRPRASRQNGREDEGQRSKHASHGPVSVEVALRVNDLFPEACGNKGKGKGGEIELWSLHRRSTRRCPSHPSASLRFIKPIGGTPDFFLPIFRDSTFAR